MKDISDVLIEIMTREEIGKVYEKIVRPLLLKSLKDNPEPLHNMFLAGIHGVGEAQWLAKIIENFFTYKDESLRQKIWGLDFRNPFGWAAGLDKNGIAVPGIAVLGGGFHEIGTWTPKSEPGDLGTRIHYLIKDRGLINHMRFPNWGVDAGINYLKDVRGSFQLPLIINIGKGPNTPIENAVDDCIYCLETSYIYSDIFTENISCPHILDLCELRKQKGLFEELISSLKEKIKELAKETGANEKPLLVKISPDDSEIELDNLLDVCLDYHVDGIVAVNTTLSREGLISPNKEIDGGYSGKKLFPTAVKRVSHVYDYTQGEILVIGVGGVFNAKDAYEMLKAGASLVQTYTGYVYQIWKFPWFFYQMGKELKELMERDGIKHISEIRKYQ